MGEISEFLPVIGALAVAGALAGFLAGLLGIGGGIVMVPALFFTFETLDLGGDYRMHLAVATALAVIVPTSFVSARAHRRRGAFDGETFRAWAPWIAVGALIGVVVAGRISSAALTLFFATMAAIMGLKLLLPLDDVTLGDRRPGGVVGRLIPLAIGGFSAMMGIGGATFSVPAMTLFGAPIHRAVGTAALIGFVIAVPAALAYVAAGWRAEGLPPTSAGFVNLAAFAVIAPVSMLAAPVGAAVAHRLNRRLLSILFGLALIGTAARLFLTA